MGIEKALEVFGIVDKVLIDEIISLVCLVLLLVPQVLQLDCIDQVKDLSTVSGLYGPGAYIAWILTFTSTLTSYEMNLSALNPFRRISQWHQRPEIGEAVDIQPPPIDVNLIASVAYPLIACADFFMRSRARIFDRELDAAACVARTSMLFTFVALRETLFQYHVRKLCNYKFTIRLSVVCTLWFYSIVIASRHALGQGSHYVFILMSFVCVAGFPIVRTIVAPSIPYMWPVYSVVCFCLGLAQLIDRLSGQPRPCDLRVRFPFPQTASKLGDLDQAAALATGLAVFMYPTLKATTRIICRLLDTPQYPPNTNQSTLPH